LIDAAPEDFLLPKLHLYQAAGKEKEYYGEHRAGNWVNGATLEEIDGMEDRVIVPIFAYKETQVWWARKKPDGTKPGGSGFVATFPTAREVPGEYRENLDYAVYNVLNYVVLVSGEDFPMVMIFKSTSYRNGQAFATLTQARATMGRGLGAYKLRHRPKSNDDGSWLSPYVQPAGDAPDDMVTLAEAFATAFAGGRIEVVDPEAAKKATRGGDVIDTETGEVINADDDGTADKPACTGDDKPACTGIDGASDIPD